MEHYLQLSFALVMATTWVPLNSGFPSLNEIRHYGTLLNQYSTHDGELRSVPGVHSNCSMGSGRITKITFIALPGVEGDSTVLQFNREASTSPVQIISLNGSNRSFGGGFGYELDLSAPSASMPFNSGDSLWIRHPDHDDSSLRLLHQVGYDERNICWRELDEDADNISCGIDRDYPLLAIETDPPHCIEGSLNATELRSMWENRATSAVPYSSPDREIMLDCTGTISRILVGAYLTGIESEEGPSIEIDGQYCNLSPDQVTEYLNVYECILESPVAVDDVDSVLIVQRNTSSRIAFLHDGESDTPLISLTISGECGSSPFLSEDDVRERTAQFIPNFIQLENDRILYPHLNITQDGYLTKWTFTAEELGQGYERPVLHIYRFNDMGVPEINNTLPGSNALLSVYPNVFEYTADPPLSVLAGDFIGLVLPPDTTARLLLSFILNNSPSGESLVNFDVNNGNIDGLPLVTLEIAHVSTLHSKPTTTARHTAPSPTSFSMPTPPSCVPSDGSGCDDDVSTLHSQPTTTAHHTAPSPTSLSELNPPNCVPSEGSGCDNVLEDDVTNSNVIIIGAVTSSILLLLIATVVTLLILIMRKRKGKSVDHYEIPNATYEVKTDVMTITNEAYGIVNADVMTTTNEAYGIVNADVMTTTNEAYGIVNTDVMTTTNEAYGIVDTDVMTTTNEAYSIVGTDVMTTTNEAYSIVDSDVMTTTNVAYAVQSKQSDGVQNTNDINNSLQNSYAYITVS